MWASKYRDGIVRTFAYVVVQLTLCVPAASTTCGRSLTIVIARARAEKRQAARSVTTEFRDLMLICVWTRMNEEHLFVEMMVGLMGQSKCRWCLGEHSIPKSQRLDFLLYTFFKALYSAAYEADILVNWQNLMFLLAYAKQSPNESLSGVLHGNGTLLPM